MMSIFWKIPGTFLSYWIVGGGIRGTQYLFGRPVRDGIAPIAKSLGFFGHSDDPQIPVEKSCRDGYDFSQFLFQLVIYEILLGETF